MDIGQQIRKISFEANSKYNDGFTKAHYRNQLKEIAKIVLDGLENKSK